MQGLSFASSKMSYTAVVSYRLPSLREKVAKLSRDCGVPVAVTSVVLSIGSCWMTMFSMVQGSVRRADQF